MRTVIINNNDMLVVEIFDDDKLSEIESLYQNLNVYYPENRPSEYHKFDWDSKKWVYDDELSLSAIQQKRAAEYPDFREYLDGIVKGDQTQIDKYINDCLAIKQKYPK